MKIQIKDNNINNKKSKIRKKYNNSRNGLPK